MKNASSSQKNHQQTEEINYSEKPFYRLVHAGLYVEVMDSIFSKLIYFESKTESNTIDVFIKRGKCRQGHRKQLCDVRGMKLMHLHAS